MIKRLRQKFIIIIMSILFVIFSIIIITINYATYKSGERQSVRMMERLAEFDGRALMNNGQVPPLSEDAEPPFVDSYAIFLDVNNTIISTLKRNTIQTFDDLTSSKLNELVSTILTQKKTSGIIDSRRYLVQNKPYGKIIILLDNTAENQLTKRLLIISVIIGSGCLILFFFVSYYLSLLIVKPVKESFEKQKQFISDASHELKTPLSIVGVNAEVLENEIGENKWLNYIKSETSRMSVLVNQLLTITRLEDVTKGVIPTHFDLSDAILQILLPFESVAFEAGKHYSYEVSESIYYTGDESGIQQVVAILVDNALKNAYENGDIRVSLSKSSGKLSIKVYNTGAGIPEGEREKIFERFYRSDSSRSRDTGGYGLGLSIAKSIVERHHGKIQVYSEPNHWTEFVVILPT